MKHPTSYIALLRGINVGGHNKIPMSDLRSLVVKMGWNHVQTYIQSGNLIFTASGVPATIEAQLEQAIARHFDLLVPVLVRAAADWTYYATGNPFGEAVKSEPNHVMLALSKKAFKSGTASDLQDRATNGERIAPVDDALWIHFPQGVARSKLSAALLDRLAGSPVTMRNWLTVVKLREICDCLEI